MKQILRIVGLILAVLGIAIALMGHIQVKEAQGASVTVGYVQNGEFHATKSGTIGRNQQKETDMKSASLLGYVSAAAGVGLLVLSTKATNE